MVGVIHQDREYKEKEMGEIMNSGWASHDSDTTGRRKLLNTRSNSYSSWGRAGDTDLEAVDMAAEPQPDQSTLTLRTTSGPLLICSLFLPSVCQNSF